MFWIVAIVAVAAIGLGFGRWVVPAGGSTGPTSDDVATVSSSASAAERIAVRGIEQRGGIFEGADVLAAVNAPSQPSAAARIAEAKIQRHGFYEEPTTLSVVVAPSGPSAAARIAEAKVDRHGFYEEPTAVAPVIAATEGQSAAARIAEAKVQRHGFYEEASAPLATSLTTGGSAAERIAERKFEQRSDLDDLLFGTR
jgi:hypothetical protein